MKLTRAIAATAFFVMLLGIVYYVHIAFFRINVIFYAAIADAVIAALLAGLILFSLGYFRPLCHFEKSLLLVIWLLAGYGFAISIPTVIDRSLSFYILEKLQQRGGGIRQESIEEVFTKEYVKEYRLVDVRLTEQLESGTIVINNDCVKLTAKGENLAIISSWFRKNLLPKQRLLMGSYTDELTNPFANSVSKVGYDCK